MQIYSKSYIAIYAIAIATLLRIANIDSYGDKRFSELHATYV